MWLPPRALVHPLCWSPVVFGPTFLCGGLLVFGCLHLCLCVGLYHLFVWSSPLVVLVAPSVFVLLVFAHLWCCRLLVDGCLPLCCCICVLSQMCICDICFAINIEAMGIVFIGHWYEVHLSPYATYFGNGWWWVSRWLVRLPENTRDYYLQLAKHAQKSRPQQHMAYAIATEQATAEKQVHVVQARMKHIYYIAWMDNRLEDRALELQQMEKEKKVEPAFIRE